MTASERSEAPTDLGHKLRIHEVVPIDGDRKVAKFTYGPLRVDSLWLNRTNAGWRCSWPHGKRGYPIVKATDHHFDHEVLRAVRLWETVRGIKD